VDLSIATSPVLPPQQHRPEGFTFIRFSGENVAGASGVRSTPEQAVTAWMNSPFHRAAIMGQSTMLPGGGFVDWTHTGVGFDNGMWVIKFITAH